MLPVGLFALVMAVFAAAFSVTTWLLDRWLVKVFDPDALPKPIKVRKAKKVPVAKLRKRTVTYPDGTQETSIQGLYSREGEDDV